VLHKETFALYRTVSVARLGRLVGYDGVRLTSQNSGLYGPIVHRRVIAMWTMVWWYRLGITPNLSTRALWQPPVLSGGPVSGDMSGASRIMGEGNENLVHPSPWDFKRSLTCPKSYDTGPPALLPIRRKVCRVFVSPLKIHRLGRDRIRDLWVKWQAH
jgi:hypothetical protein